MNLHGKNFLKLLDFSPEEIAGLLDLAADLKAKKKNSIPHRMHEGKNVALIFEKTSTRTRCSFEVAAADLGMHAVYLDPKASQLGKKESIADTARVLGRMFDGIEYRGFEQARVEKLAKYAGVPVWNGLTNEFHPTQILADFLTMREHFGELRGKKLVYLGDARYNMGNSLMVGSAKMGLEFTACAPEKYFPDKALIAQCREIAAETGAVLKWGRRTVYGYLGLDGRAGRGLGRTHRRSEALSDQRKADGDSGSAVPLYALPAGVSRSGDGKRAGSLSALRTGRAGSDRRGVRERTVDRL